MSQCDVFLNSHLLVKKTRHKKIANPKTDLILVQLWTFKWHLSKKSNFSKLRREILQLVLYQNITTVGLHWVNCDNYLEKIEYPPYNVHADSKIFILITCWAKFWRKSFFLLPHKYSLRGCDGKIDNKERIYIQN